MVGAQSVWGDRDERGWRERGRGPWALWGSSALRGRAAAGAEEHVGGGGLPALVFVPLFVSVQVRVPLALEEDVLPITRSPCALPLLVDHETPNHVHKI